MKKKFLNKKKKAIFKKEYNYKKTVYFLTKAE